MDGGATALRKRNTELGIPMPTSARSSRDLETRLVAYCAQHGLSKTEVIARGLELLFELKETSGRHAAFTAYQRIAPAMRAAPQRDGRLRSSEAIRRALRARHPVPTD